jgi:hypothetical protein
MEEDRSMYTVESILMLASNVVTTVDPVTNVSTTTGLIRDRSGRMIRGARVHLGGDVEIMCLYISKTQVYWSAQGTAVSVDWLRRYLEMYQHQTYIDPQMAAVVLPTLR